MHGVAGDFGTCAGLNAECCKLWLLECDLRCEGAADQQKLAFECGGLKLRYECKCEGEGCPTSYCAASQCPSQASGGTGTDEEVSPRLRPRPSTETGPSAAMLALSGSAGFEGPCVGTLR